MLFDVLVVFHVIICILLIIVVLMQSSKGGGLSASFGGGGGQTLFGGRETATFLSKATTYLAVIFMVSSLSLALLSAGRGTKQQQSALRKAAKREGWGTIVPEEQKNVDEVIGNVPQPTEKGKTNAGSTNQKKSSSGGTSAPKKAPEKK